MISVIDYGRGNLFSLAQALAHIGAAHRITSDPQVLLASERIIFPGVGAFGDAAEGLRTRGLEAPLRRAAGRGVPVLGICVGCQLLLEHGEEFGRHRGLGLIRGTVRRLPDPVADDPAAIRIPNVGWRRLDARTGDPLLSMLNGEMVYFVHSFAPMVDDPAEAAAHIIVNGQNTPVAIRRGNIAGVQFHPEKSGAVGLALLKRFAKWTAES
jgi:glutamine amidotransferase